MIAQILIADDNEDLTALCRRFPISPSIMEKLLTAK